MRATVAYIVQKEFLQIFRNRAMLPLIFLMPFIQLIILANAATFELRNIDLFLVDHDQSPTSRVLVERFTSSGYFRLVAHSFDVDQGMDALLRNEANMVLIIPSGFSRAVDMGGNGEVQLLFDAVDSYSAGIAQQYVSSILATFGSDFAPLSARREVSAMASIHIEASHWYNPHLNYETYMVPGILVILITMIGLFLSAMNIVREREIGTIEQLNVTPIAKHQFIIGKLLPFWVIGLFELGFGLLIARWLFDVPIVGSLALIFGIAAIYLVAVLGIGLLVSTITETQQQAMFISWFILVVFILMSGLFTPIESMPQWAQHLTLLNPVAWFIDLMRRILLSGAGLRDVLPSVLALATFAAVMIRLSVWRFTKVSGS